MDYARAVQLLAAKHAVAAGSLLYRPRADAWRMVVVAKLAFDLVPTRCRLRSEPAPIVARERRGGGPPVDLVPFKAQPEFVVVGAPQAVANPAELVIAVTVAGHRKAVTLAPRATPATLDELGPIPARAPVRQARLGARASSWSDENLQARVLEDDFDRRYFQAAPSDQWLPSLSDEASIVLEHLHRDHPRLETSLPGVAPAARVERGEGTTEALELVADTLVIDVGVGRITVTWRAAVDLERPDQAGKIRFGLREDEDVTWEADTSSEIEPDPQSVSTLRLDDRQAEVARGRRGPQRTRPNLDIPRYAGGEGTAEAMSSPKPMGPGWLARDGAKEPSAPPPPPRRRTDDPPSPSKPPLPSSPPPAPPPRIDEPLPKESWSSGKRGSVPPPNPLAKMLDSSPEIEPEPKPASEPEPDEPRAETGPIELIWHDDEVVDRVRSDASLASLLPPEPEPPKPAKPKRGQAPAPPPPPPDPKDEVARARRDVAIAVGKAAPTSLSSLEGRVVAALKAEEPKPPLVVVAGLLRLRFDEAEALTITCQLARPVANRHKPLAEAIALAEEAAEALTAAPAMARPLRNRVEEAWRKGNRDLPANYLEDGVRRALLEKRAYRQVTLLGRPLLVGALEVADERPLVAYLPDTSKDFLPLYTSLDARLLVEVLPRQDEAEAHRLALLVLALGRRVAIGPGHA